MGVANAQIAMQNSDEESEVARYILGESSRERLKGRCGVSALSPSQRICSGTTTHRQPQPFSKSAPRWADPA